MNGKRWSPSIRRLTLIGFIAVSFPLMVALGVALWQLEALSSEGASAVSEVADSIDATRQAAQLLQNMERTVSQSQVLQDPALFDRYQDLRGQWLELMNSHQGQNDPAVMTLLHRLRQQEQQLYQRISQTDTSMAVSQIQQAYAQLQAMSQQIYQRNRAVIGKRIAAIESKADELRQSLLQASWLFPITLIIALLFLWLIGRPLKRLKQQIRRLEKGDLSTEVAIGGAEDITEVGEILDTMRRQLLTLEQQKTGFIRQISHELKTPLAAIREGSELLYDGTAGPLTESQQEVAEIIRTSVNRLQQLIEDLLNFNLLLDDTSMAADNHCRVLAVLQRVERERRLELNNRELSVGYPEDDECWPMHEEHLRTVLDNVLSNAIKFSPQGGSITFTLTQSDKARFLRIQDQGPGVPESQQERIFDPFVQGDAGNHGKLKSSGLGLTIARELMAKYGGTLTAKTNDEGGCFSLSLPDAAFHKE